MYLVVGPFHLCRFCYSRTGCLPLNVEKQRMCVAIEGLQVCYGCTGLVARGPKLLSLNAEWSGVSVRYSESTSWAKDHYGCTGLVARGPNFLSLNAEYPGESVRYNCNLHLCSEVEYGCAGLSAYGPKLISLNVEWMGVCVRLFDL